MTDKLPKIPTPFVAGDTDQVIRIVLGEDVTTATVQLLYVQPDGTTITKAASVNEALQGDVQFALSGVADLVAGADQMAQVKLTDGGLVGTRACFLFDVKASL